MYSKKKPNRPMHNFFRHILQKYIYRQKTRRITLTDKRNNLICNVVDMSLFYPLTSVNEIPSYLYINNVSRIVKTKKRLI